MKSKEQLVACVTIKSEQEMVSLYMPIPAVLFSQQKYHSIWTRLWSELTKKKQNSSNSKRQMTEQTKIVIALDKRNDLGNVI